MGVKEVQQKVSRFVENHGLEAAPGFRLIDLVSEIGEIAKETAESTEYGLKPREIEVEKDEIGDAMFSLLALANDLDIDVEDAVEKSLGKYRKRIEKKGDPSSR